MLGMLFLSGCVLFLVSLVMSLALIFSKKSFSDREKNSPFECGFDPAVSSRLPFSLRFFLIALIFLIFDVEIVLIFPSILAMVWASFLGWAMLFLFFGVVLLLGLYYEWNYGALDWSL